MHSDEDSPLDEFYTNTTSLPASPPEKKIK
jgi:hypothetical protein